MAGARSVELRLHLPVLQVDRAEEAMESIWYYVEREASRGPVTLTELASLLGTFGQPREVLVWRQGWTDWRPAGSVPEVLSVLRTAAPADPMGISKSAADASSARVAGAADVGPANDSELSGIEGWLVLLALGLVFGSIRFLVSIVQYFGTLDSDLARQFPLAVIGEVLLNIALAALFICTLVLFFRRAKRFPRMYVYFIAGSVLIPLIGALWSAWLVSNAIGLAFGPIFWSAFGPSEIRDALTTLIFGTIWIVYLKRSRRAANTFVR
jgi:Protein of unknown function (DUF2569)/GYF domain 2